MNLHVFKRATTRSLVAFCAGGVALAAANQTVQTEPQEMSPEKMFAVLAGFVVVIAGALTAVVVRWLQIVGKRVPRAPERDLEAFGRVEAKLDKMDDKLDNLDRRVSRIEGNLGSFVVLPEGNR